MRQTRTYLTLFLVAIVVGVSRADAKDDWSANETLNAAAKQGREYRERFEKAGHDGLADLLKDKDTGVSLQAAWELNRKLIKLPKRPPLWDTDDSYDPEGMKTFLKHVNARTGLTAPDWWQKNLLENISVRKGTSHVILGSLPSWKKVPLGATTEYLSNVVWMAEGDMLAAREKVLTFTTNKRSVSFSERLCPYQSDAVASCVSGNVTVLAIFSKSGGPCPLLGFDHENNKRLWAARVWSCARDIGANGVHQRIELVTTKDTVAVFGSELAGAFLECFDLKTGEVRYRFCSSYWGSHSERWNLK